MDAVTDSSRAGELATWSHGLARLRRALEIVYADDARPADAIVRAASLLFDADAAVLRVPDQLRAGSGFVVACHGALSAEVRVGASNRVAISRVEDIAIARGRTIVVPSPDEPGLPNPGGLGRQASSVIVTPVAELTDPLLGGAAVRSGVSGVLVVASHDPAHVYDELDAELADTFASVCEHVLRNDRRTAALAKAHDDSVHASSHDGLTGLANRPRLLERLNDALDRARTSSTMVGVAFIDLDDFRLVNEHYGHEVGDRLLVAFSSRLRRILRTDEFAARVAVDEFVVVLEDIDDEIYGHLLVERVRIALGQPFQLGEAGVLADASFGLAFARGSDRRVDAPELLHEVTVALYRAKEEGKARSVVFDASMRDRTLAERDLASNLRSAVRSAPTDGSGPLELYYQPVVDLETGEVASVEALLRWHGPTHDISPDDFIPIAETSGLIAPLGRWVLESACRHLARFRVVSPELSIGINLSGRQLADLSIVSDVSHAIRSAGLPPDAVTLEVTETYLLERSEMAIRCLAELREIGVKTALDDFGTGYSSLTSLRLFRFDECKIDRAFVQGLDGSASDRALGEMLIGVARQLGMKVVGEGVETPSQLARLKDLACDYGQGFHLGRPMPSEQLLVHLARRCATTES